MTIVAYAVVLTLCTGPSYQDQCNDYHIAVKEHRFEAVNELVYESDLMGLAWTSREREKAVAAYLKPFNVGEPVSSIVEYDYTIAPLHESDIP